MKRPWRVAGGTAIAGWLLLALLLVDIKAYGRREGELRHSHWSADTIPNRSRNGMMTLVDTHNCRLA